MYIGVLIGHGKSDKGEYDPGACSQGYEEYQLAKEIGKYAVDTLKGYDCAVDLVNYDATLNLPQRIKYCNAGDYDLIVEIHLNASGDGKGTGCEVYHSIGDKKGREIAAQISGAVSAALKIPDRGARTRLNDYGYDYFGIIRQTSATALLVETCFIDSNDVFTVFDALGQQKAGQAIGSAIASACGLVKRAERKYKVELYPLTEDEARSLAEAMRRFADTLPGLYTIAKIMDNGKAWKTQTAPISSKDRAEEIALALRTLAENKPGVTAQAYVILE